MERVAYQCRTTIDGQAHALVYSDVSCYEACRQFAIKVAMETGLDLPNTVRVEVFDHYMQEQEEFWGSTECKSFLGFVDVRVEPVATVINPRGDTAKWEKEQEQCPTT